MDDGTPALVRAAMAHLHLVSIHPWADGNGRMSRSLREYYRELADRGPTYLPDQDVSSWIRFNLTACHQQAQTVAGRLDRSGRVWGALTSFADSTRLDERVVTALHDVAMAGRVRRSRYEHAEGLSLQQAQRDLRDLTTAQILAPAGRTRARYYTAGPRFPQAALDLAHTPMTLRHPYAT